MSGTAAGCASQQSDPFVVTVQAPPAAPTAGNNGPICAGGTLALTASGATGATYSWTGPNGFASSAQNPTIASAPASASGVYNVFVTVNGCASPAASTTAVVRTLPSSSISSAPSACPLSSGNFASIPSAGAGAVYSWSIVNGSITSGAGTRAITFTAGPSGSVSLSVTVTDAAGCASTGSASVLVRSGPACGANFFSVPPCRIVDTRAPTGPYGAPSLQARASRTFVLANRCGIPSTARAVAANLTATGATAIGFLNVYAAGLPPPDTSVLNFHSAAARGSFATVSLGPSGDVIVFCSMGEGSVDLIVDVVGYLE